VVETVALRIDVETGIYATFPENFKAYTDVKAVVGIGEFNQGIDEFSERPVFWTQDGAVASGSGQGLSDNYTIEPIGKGMFVDNIAGTDEIDTAVEGLLKGRSGQYHHVEHATFIGEEAIAAAVEALDKSGQTDAVLVRQLAVLAVNYANRDVQDLVYSA